MLFPYHFSFTTLSPPKPQPPRVVGTTPPNGSTDIKTSTDIGIIFSQVMEKSPTESAVSASPPISGKFSWFIGNDTLRWRVSPDLLGNTKYTITVSTAARSIAGLNLVAPYTFSFTTQPTYQPPHIIATFPSDKATDISVTATISVLFTEAMERNVTGDAVTSSPTINWSAAWKNNDSELVLTPSSPLMGETRYNVTVGVEARSTDHMHLLSPYLFSFTTRNASEIAPPTVLSTSPSDNATDIDPLSQITITFSEPMDRNATEKAVSMTPGSIVKMGWDSSGTILTATASLEVRTRHNMTISTGAKNLAGIAMVKNYTFSFSTKGRAISNVTLSLPVMFVVLLLVVFFLMVLRKEKRTKSKQSASKKGSSSPSKLKKGQEKESGQDK
jgi:methionine-rich copper-binding protein CopC